MRKVYLAIFFVFTISMSFAQNMNNHRYVVFDITGSMVGRGQNSNGNIWDESIGLLTKQLKAFANDEIITFYTFGKQLTKVGDYKIDSNGDYIKNILKSLEKVESDDSFEMYTCIYESLDRVINTFDKEQINTIYLFTDGNQTRKDIFNCGNANSLSVLTKFKNVSRPYDYLYILKLTDDFHIENEEAYEKEENIEIIPDAINNLYVNITPTNHKIRVSKAALSSEQSFNITGTGVDYLPKGIKLITNTFSLKGDETNQENSATIKPNSFLLKDTPYTFLVHTQNELVNISNEIHVGSINYTFENGKKEKVIKNNAYTITIKINPNISDVIINNKNEESKVTIEFID